MIKRGLICFTLIPVVLTWEGRDFPPQGAFGNDWRYFWLSQLGWECYRQLADGGQGGCWISRNAQYGPPPPNQRLRQYRSVNTAAMEEPWFIPSSTSHACTHTRTPQTARIHAHTHAHPKSPVHMEGTVCVDLSPGELQDDVMLGETHTGLR